MTTTQSDLPENTTPMQENPDTPKNQPAEGAEPAEKPKQNPASQKPPGK